MSRRLTYCVARSGYFGLGQRNFLGAAFGGFLGKLKGHGLDGALELEHERLALRQSLAKLVEFALGFFQLGSKVILEFFGIHT